MDNIRVTSIANKAKFDIWNVSLFGCSVVSLYSICFTPAILPVTCLISGFFPLSRTALTSKI